MYFIKAISWFLLIMPIIIIFFQENNLSLSEIMLLPAVYSFTIVLFEIPSGLFSDKFGRKKSIIISTFFTFIGYLIFSNTNSFNFFLIAEVFIGIGTSMISGADSALIYDTLEENNLKKNYTKVEGKMYAIGNLSESIAGIIGGFIASSSIFLPVYIQTIIVFFSIPLAFSLFETKINNKKGNNKGIIHYIMVSKDILVNNTQLKWLIVFSAAMGTATLSIAWFSQAIFKELEINIIYFGILWAILNGVASLSSYFSHVIENKFKTKEILLFLIISTTLCFICIGLFKNIIVIFFIILIYIFRGIATPLLKNQINNNSLSVNRATILSVRSFAIRLLFAITSPLLGLISDKYSLDYVFYSLAIIFLIISSIASIKLAVSR